jgi:hypothetical protein
VHQPRRGDDLNETTPATSPTDRAWTSDDAPAGMFTRRRLMAHVLPAVALAGGVALGCAHGVEAGITWCRAHPIITINGKQFHVYILSTEEMYQNRTGPTGIIVKYP